ncbi:MAG: hypothetical protein OEQ53_20660 [Saprospiraceae bacterium]|nr:hypothetical protein [Saprospiraceae bacterium]
MWKKKLERYDKLVETNPKFERKGKTVPYTSANGYMFSLLNKDGELGIRLSKESGKKFMEEYQTTRFKSHGYFMQGYVLIPEKMFDNMELLSKYLNESFSYVMSLEPKASKK